MMLDAALWWAGRGVPVLPLHFAIDGTCSCGQPECSNVAKHPIASLVPKGLHSATTDPDTIRKWWTEHPEANIGVRTGEVFDVIDVDSRDGGVTLAALFAEHGTPDHLAVVRSGREGFGMHVYAVPGGQKALAGGRTAPDGIDVKGRGGYVVAPPSVHASGAAYRFDTESFGTGEIMGGVPWEVFYGHLRTTTDPVRVTPSVRLDSQASDAYGRAVVNRALELISGAGPGHRWQTLATEAVPLVARAIDGGIVDYDTTVRELTEAAESIGLDTGELRRIPGLVDDLLNRGITNPIRGTQRVELAPLPEYETEDEARTDDWEPPIPLTLPTPAFPTSVFGWLEDYVLDVANTYQVPPDLVGMMLLAVVSALVGKTARVQVTDTWDEPLNLYVAVVLRAGETKSPALAHLLRPIRDMEKREREEATGRIAKLEFQREIAEQKAKTAKERAYKAGTEYEKIEAQNAALEAIAELNRIDVPVLPLRLAGDMTPEALITKLAEQGGQLAHISAEGDLLDSIVGGRYSQGQASIGGLLMAHDGREPVRVHRKHADDIEVPDPCLTLGLAIQPDVLRKLGESGAAMNRGLAARFLYSVPASRIGTRNMTLRNNRGAVMDDISSKFLNILKTRLSEMTDSFEDFEDTGRGLDDWKIGGFEAKEEKHLKLLLRDTTISILEHYRSELEARRRAEIGDLTDVASWANKLDGQTVRLAGLLQLIRECSPDTSSYGLYPQNPQNLAVSPDAMADAITLSEYLIAHAIEAHAIMRATESGERQDRAAQLAGWLRGNGASEITRREMQQTLRRRASFRDPEVLRETCEDLERGGYLRRLPEETGRPGRPTVRYLVSPWLST